jgi:anaerobic selenocysteine-containing dehydrogenase
MAVKRIRGECCECVNCCGVVYHVEDGKLIKVEGDPLSPINQGELCPKGEVMIDQLYSEERLKTPLKKEGDKFVPISWDQAMDEISGKLAKIRDEYGPEALVCYAGSVAVERLESAAFLQRFRMAYGTPNYFSVETG